MEFGMREQFLGVPIDILSLHETVDLADKSISSRERCQHVALNVAKFVKMRRQPEIWRDVVESDIVGIDGMGILGGARLPGSKAHERVVGIDLFKAQSGRQNQKLCDTRLLLQDSLGPVPPR
jgi:N-acetylglucosaminyldiphosphoundecaprenol N-acetyl-beta-D-mannosaminyltransferase